MGWGFCGYDSKGRPIGYSIESRCDHPGCTKVIDRGLSYACGGDHGENEDGCEGYFCGDHLYHCEYYDRDVCAKCLKWMEEYFTQNPDEDPRYEEYEDDDENGTGTN